MTRLIEWIGQSPLLQDPTVEYRLRTKTVTPAQARVLRAWALKRIVRVTGKTYRDLLTHELPGLSRSYRWGVERDSYVQPMPDHDAELILNCGSAEEFLDVTDGPKERPPLVLPKELGIEPVDWSQFKDYQHG